MFGFRCFILQKCGAGGKKTTGFFHHSQVEKTRIIPKDCEIINMKTRKSKKKFQKMYYLSADSQYFWVVKKIDIFLGVLIFFFCCEEHAFRTKMFLLPRFFTSIYRIHYFYGLNFWLSESEDLVWFLKCLRLAIYPLMLKFFLHCLWDQ